ncbi:hypothetical protein MKW98_015400 [Papaver atlanticum]|uniref:Uncharacterized protein n=1 Tax=Papaver atlanticum TaxID=357466 RepID=A0AAD4RY84_9MAGN|nr:hypothetical protein MKW98_015400 [Papaver atlanticum]
MNNNISAANSLDILLQKYAFKELLVHNRRTGSLYHSVLPTNLTGIRVSVVRLRTGSFWIRGANFSDFRIPPRVKPIPYVKRLAIVYQNLGNLSSQYYNVPGNYSMVTPVIGFIVYNATNLNKVNGMKKIANLTTTRNSISVHFTLPSGLNISQAKCVKFNEDGSPHFSELKHPNICLTNDQGHFAVVTVRPEPHTEEKKKKKDRRLLVWLILSIVFGVFALLFIGVLGFVVYRIVKMRRIGAMEKEAENGEAFDTVWIGNSKLPSATSMRTNPIIEYSESAPY